MAVVDADVYPSRVAHEPQVIERVDPVVYGDADQGPLADEQVHQYERDGFLILPHFLSPDELAACRAELERLRHNEQIKRRPEAIVEPECNALRSLFWVHQLSDHFRSVAAHLRVAGMARQLLGSDVYVHQSRVNLKPGFRGRDFYWHSDFETWHVEDGMPRMRAVSCSILLTPNHAHNGPLMLVPGSHRQYISCVGETPEGHYHASLRRQELGVPDEANLERMIAESGITSAIGDAGTLVLFDCNTMHGSNGNITPDPRSNLFFVFNSMENRLQEPYCGLEPRPEYIATREHVTPV